MKRGCERILGELLKGRRRRVLRRARRNLDQAVIERAVHLDEASRSFTGRTVRYLLGPREYTPAESTTILGRAIGRAGLGYVLFDEASFKQGLLGAGFAAAVADLLPPPRLRPHRRPLREAFGRAPCDPDQERPPREPGRPRIRFDAIGDVQRLLPPGYELAIVDGNGGRPPRLPASARVADTGGLTLLRF